MLDVTGLTVNGHCPHGCSRYLAHVRLVDLWVSRSRLQERLTERTGHFAGVSLLESQLALLEGPKDALAVDGSQPVEQLVQIIRRSLHL